MILVSLSLLFIINLLSERAAVATSASPAPNATEPMRNTTTGGGLTNNNNTTTNVTGGAISATVNDRLENTTSALENTTAALTNATKALQNISNIIPTAGPTPTSPPTATITTGVSAVNATSVINSIFENNLPAVFIIVIASIIGVPLVLDIILAYRRKPPAGSSTDSSNRVVGMPDLYRSLMTFGIIVLVGTVIFYLLALITLNINDSTSPALQSL